MKRPLSGQSRRPRRGPGCRSLRTSVIEGVSTVGRRRVIRASRVRDNRRPMSRRTRPELPEPRRLRVPSPDRPRRIPTRRTAPWAPMALTRVRQVRPRTRRQRCPGPEQGNPRNLRVTGRPGGRIGATAPASMPPLPTVPSPHRAPWPPSGRSQAAGDPRQARPIRAVERTVPTRIPRPVSGNRKAPISRPPLRTHACQCFPKRNRHPTEAPPVDNPPPPLRLSKHRRRPSGPGIASRKQGVQRRRPSRRRRRPAHKGPTSTEWRRAMPAPWGRPPVPTPTRQCRAARRDLRRPKPLSQPVRNHRQTARQITSPPTPRSRPTGTRPQQLGRQHTRPPMSVGRPHAAVQSRPVPTTTPRAP